MTTMENLMGTLFEGIDKIGLIDSNDAFDDMQFKINCYKTNNRLQDYINTDIPSIHDETRESKNVIITSPTQVGKTSYIIENCKKNKNQPYLFVLTCDNSKEQLKQLKTRLTDNGIVVYDLKTITKTKIENSLFLGKALFIVMLNNAVQITKLETLVNKLRVNCRPKQYVIFHDEADTINKADIGSEIDDNTIPMSHRKWHSFIGTIEKRNEVIKRFWVTATPENCSSLSKITGKDIVVLPVPDNYISVSEHNNWDGKSSVELGYEIERIRHLNNGEVILYCIDKKKTIQNDTAQDISSKFKCVSLCYNGDGTIVFRNGKVNGRSEFFKDDISNILDKLRDCGPIVVVGYNLMNRGISFVAAPNCKNDKEQLDQPPTATVMFYSGGTGSHLVGIAQRFGRICGTSRPDLFRRVVYCKNDVYDDYNAYLENQKSVFDRLEEGFGDMTMAEILSESGVAKSIRRTVDRPNLKSVNNEYSSSCKTSSSTNGPIEVYDENKMHRLVDSWKDAENDTAIARLFRRMLANGGRLESGVVREMVGDGPMSAMTLSHHAREYNLVFKKDGRYHYIRKEVMQYLQ